MAPMLRMVPGPTSMSAGVRQVYAEDIGSPDVELEEFAADYFALTDSFQRLLSFNDGSIAIGSGEGMACLWGAMKSVLSPGDVVVSAANGIYGQGFADMAKGMGATVITVESAWTTGIDPDAVIAAIKQHNPRLVTMVHCETPTGILNPFGGIGHAVRHDTTAGLFLVDFVSSSFATPLNVSAESIDIGLFAPQKALSGPAALAGTTVSDRAWKRILELKYQGYDALAPFHGLNRSAPAYMPYTHNWPAIRATLQACRELESEGLENIVRRHADATRECHALAKVLGLVLYCEDPAVAAPTVTALHVPSHVEWNAFVKALKREGLICGGNYGDLAGKDPYENKLVAFYRDEEEWLRGSEYDGAGLLVALVLRKMITHRFVYQLQWVPLASDALGSFDPSNAIHVNENLCNYVHLNPEVDFLTLAQGREMFYSLGIQTDPHTVLRSVISPETQEWHEELPWEMEVDTRFHSHEAKEMHVQQMAQLRQAPIPLARLVTTPAVPPDVYRHLPSFLGSPVHPTKMHVKPHAHEVFAHSAVASFLAYLPTSFWQDVVGATNTHGISAGRLATPTAFTLDEIMTFLGILLHVRLVNAHEHVQDHWSQRSVLGLDCLESIMPFARFTLLHACFRCAKFRDPTDPLTSIRPLIQTFQRHCGKYVVPGQDVFVSNDDDGRVIVVDYKHVDVVTAACADTGVVVNFKVHVSSNPATCASVALNVVEVVHPLCHSRRVVHVHTPFVSEALVHRLRANGLYCRGSTPLPDVVFAAAPVLVASDQRPHQWAQTPTPHLFAVTSWAAQRIAMGLLTNADDDATPFPTAVHEHLRIRDRHRKLRRWASFAPPQDDDETLDCRSWALQLMLRLLDLARVNAFLTRAAVVDDDQSMWAFTSALSVELMRGEWKYAPPHGMARPAVVHVAPPPV
ncbi:hypothetical protein As57867_021402, partial [Aphanomyces stellatus]